jgi:hypothetical protein
LKKLTILLTVKANTPKVIRSAIENIICFVIL